MKRQHELSKSLWPLCCHILCCENAVTLYNNTHAHNFYKTKQNKDCTDPRKWKILLQKTTTHYNRLLLQRITLYIYIHTQNICVYIYYILHYNKKLQLHMYATTYILHYIQLHTVLYYYTTTTQCNNPLCIWHINTNVNKTHKDGHRLSINNMTILSRRRTNVDNKRLRQQRPHAAASPRTPCVSIKQTPNTTV